MVSDDRKATAAKTLNHRGHSALKKRSRFVAHRWTLAGPEAVGAGSAARNAGLFFGF